MMHNSPSARLIAARAFWAQVKPKDATPSRTLTNATSSGTYTGNAMRSPRDNAGLPSVNGRGV